MHDDHSRKRWTLVFGVLTVVLAIVIGAWVVRGLWRDLSSIHGSYQQADELPHD